LPSKRNINLKKYGISEARFTELKGYCLQYNEWRDKLKYETDAVKGQQITGMPFSGGISDSTMNLAMRREELFQKCQSVEQTMIKAITTLKKESTDKLLYDGDYQDIYDHLLKSVTNKDVNYTYLDKVMNIKITFYSYNKFRRYFFFLLDKYRVW
jgi:hypothetical protein